MLLDFYVRVCTSWFAVGTGGVGLYNEKSGNQTVIAPKRQDHNLGPTIVNLITLGFNLV